LSCGVINICRINNDFGEFEDSGHDMIWQETDKFDDIMVNTILPETIPHSARRCEFVEEGSTFVSWDGKVKGTRPL
jgi:hypothetical protein